MNFIPLAYIKDKKIHFDKTSKPVSKERFLREIISESRIYILDLDGINKDKPNLCIYQNLSNSYDLWVDYGPRTLGDIVDVFFTGATSITIRKKLCPKLNLTDIREITENKFYLNMEFEKNRYHKINDELFNESDGLVNFYSKNQIESKNNNLRYLLKYRAKNNIFTYEEDPYNINYWKRYGIKDFLIEKNKSEEFKKWIRK
jgi:uncharacterized protein related to proFAR isomerase